MNKLMFLRVYTMIHILSMYKHFEGKIQDSYESFMGIHISISVYHKSSPMEKVVFYVIYYLKCSPEECYWN